MVREIDTPIYRLSRSRSKILVELKHRTSSQETAVERRKPEQKSERDEVVDGLQQEIDRLATALRTEQANHSASKQQAVMELKEKLDEMRQSHSNEMRKLEEEGAHELSDLKADLGSELDECKKQMDAVINELQRQIELLEAQFVAYRTRLLHQFGMESRLRDARIKCSADLQSRVFELRMELMEEKQKDLCQQEEVYKQTLDQLQYDHKQEIQLLRNRFSESTDDEKKMMLVENQLKELPVELEEMEENYRNICALIDESQLQNAELERRLKQCEESFEERTRQVDQQYENTLNNLRLQYIAIRRLYLKKCGQLTDDNLNEDANITYSINSLKDMMKMLIETHYRTDTSFVDHGLETTEHQRRFSVPSANFTKSLRTKEL
jgi:chromosome segregation ATPase